LSESYSKFKEDVALLVSPDGVPEGLLRAFDFDCIQALIDVQRWIKYFKFRNKEVHPHCSTYFSCGASVVEQPRGRIQRVYTLQGDCCPIFYDWEPEFDAFQNWLIANRRRWTDPSDEGKPALPAGFHYASESLNKGRRFNFGQYTLHNGRLYLGHRIESTESIVVEYEGIKRSYKDADLMPYDDPETGDVNDPGVELKNLVAAYVRAEFMRKYERSKDWVIERQVWKDLRADMIHENWAENTPKDQPYIKEFDQPQVAGACADTHCVVTVPSEASVVGIIADFGSGNADAATVADMVNGWNPDYIFAVGDTWYGNSLLLSDLVDRVGTIYGDYIPNDFYVVPGNHDRDPVGRFAIVRDYFKMPDRRTPSGPVRNTGYYSFIRGNVEYFVYDAGYDSSQVNQQPDGVDVNSKEAAWLRTALANSKARWKVVGLHQPPFTSVASSNPASTLSGDGYLAYPALRLPFKEWGADIVLMGHGHIYERLEKDDFTYIMIPSGGQPEGAINATPSPYSKLRSNALGASRLTVTCNEWKLETFAIDGSLIEKFVMSKD
jgi:tartrate-resistant acid phosphatase type 5